MELASMAAPTQNRLSKVFLAGLRTQPTEEDTHSSLEAEQTTAGLAMSSLSSLTLSDTAEPTATLNSNSTDRQVITWNRLVTESDKDPIISSLVKLITSGTPEDKALWPEGTREYHKLRSELSTTGPVVLFRKRVISHHACLPTARNSGDTPLRSPGHNRYDSQSNIIGVLAWDIGRHKQKKSSLHQL